MKVYWGSEGIGPRILNIGTGWRWVVSFTPRPLYPQEKSPWYPLDRRLGGTQNRTGCGGGEKNSQPLPGLEPPVIQPVAQRYTTELSRLQFWNNQYKIKLISSDNTSDLYSGGITWLWSVAPAIIIEGFWCFSSVFPKQMLR
jgi:hypothetical protein